MSQTPEKCCICQNPAPSTPEASGWWLFACPRCGTFRISEYVKMLAEGGYTPQRKAFSARQRAVVSSLLRAQRDYFELHEGNQEYFFEVRDLPILEKADRLLLHIEQQTSNMNGYTRYVPIEFDNLALQAECWAMDGTELSAIFSLLLQRDFIKHYRGEAVGQTGKAEITAAGWERLEQLRSLNQDSTQGFVAMWFDASMDAVYDIALAPAIANAGYAPHRVDKREHADKIDDEIILQIRRSRFLVADATGHRGGVYYEAGFAHGLALPVFWTCRKDAMEDLHFDVRQYNCLVWEPDKLDEFRIALARRIEAVLGRGPQPTA